ncbi:unnamed protein product [Rotaria magnacalcarata]|uniref:Dynamin N-terminal domain-containing protein n=1 Tax=Rotaria magnacalcarata TaxID=392030 RepID=A0A816FFC4_9BILA|nr:unnamed protein product [Rotaria magnacalcarata]CAF1660813.1 unnamed protein product [Rotaria magnacalcarata]CAF1971935.1 unnamed protein product [Rotaria magnacalcarata]
MEDIEEIQAIDNDTIQSLSSIDGQNTSEDSSEKCRIGHDPIVDSAMFKAYETLRKIALDFHLEQELAVPRTVIVGDTSSGKSMLVQMFLRFPCAFSQANVGTRCPVQYKLRYDPNLQDGEIHFIQPRHWRAEDLSKNLQLEMERIEKTYKNEGGFRLEPFIIEIASKHYTDFEILDVPGLVSGDLDANKRAAVEAITEHYVRDPSFMIVQLKEAQQLADNTYGTRRIGELCTSEPAQHGSKFPARKDYAQHTITIQTKFDAFMREHDNGTAANDDIRTRIAFFPNAFFTNMVVSPFKLSDHSYQENVEYIARLPELEKTEVDEWINHINSKTNTSDSKYQSFNKNYRPLIGIDVVRKQIQELWLRAFRAALPRLHETINRLISKYSNEFDTALFKLEQQDPRTVRNNYQKYIESFRTTISDYAAYRAEVNAWFPLDEYGRTYEQIENEYNTWTRKQSLTWRAYLSSEQLKQNANGKVLSTLDLPYIGARHFERLRQVFSYMILSHEPLTRERDWFESSQSLLYGAVSDYENTEKAVRESLFTLIRETFLIGICWLTQMYTFLTDHFANHVKSVLLNNQFSHLEEHVKFLSLVDLEYHTVTRKFIRNAVTAIKQARYAKMIYAVHNVCGTLQNLVGSFSHMHTITESKNHVDDNNNDNHGDNNNGRNGLGNKVLQVAQDAIPKIMSGANPIVAIGSSAIATITDRKNPLDLIYATGKFLTSDRNPQTVNYLPQTRDMVGELYTAVRGQLLHDITTNFFANLVVEIQQYKSISIENSLQNRLNRLTDKDIAHMANIEIDSSRQKVIDNHENITRLEQARDAVEDVIALLNSMNKENYAIDTNGDSDNVKKRIRETHQKTRSKRLHDITKKLGKSQRHKKTRRQPNIISSNNGHFSSDVIHDDRRISTDTHEDGNNSDDETSGNEDEVELMTYNDKTSSETYLLDIFRKHDQEDLELGFLTGDSINADVKFVQQRKQQQTLNLPMNENRLEQLISFRMNTNPTLRQSEDTLHDTTSDNDDDQNSVIDVSNYQTDS